MHEGDARLDGREVGDQPEVHDLLHRVGRELREAGLAARHDVAVVVEDGEGMLGDCPRGDVEDGRHELARDEVEVGDHEQEALRRGEGRGQPAGREPAVHGARRTGFALHRRHLESLAEAIDAALGGPRVDVLAHRRGGRDGVDERRLAHAVGDV